MKRKCSGNAYSTVALRRAPTKSLLDWINNAIEIIIFAKLQLFKNYPRANLFVVRAIYIASLITAVSALLVFLLHHPLIASSQFSLLGIKLKEEPVDMYKAVATFLGIASVAYWNLTSVYRSQWGYCSDLYNKILSAENIDERNLLANALAMDLIVTDLWAHRSFSQLFQEEVIESFESVYRADTSAFKKIKKKLLNGELNEDDALWHLENRQDYLFETSSGLQKTSQKKPKQPLTAVK